MESLHKEEIIELLEFISDTAEKIIRRTAVIKSVDDFLLSDAGMETSLLNAVNCLIEDLKENSR